MCQSVFVVNREINIIFVDNTKLQQSQQQLILSIYGLKFNEDSRIILDHGFFMRTIL